MTGTAILPWRCAICGAEFSPLRDPMLPPVPLGRLRICRQCRRVVCWRHGKRVGGGEYECVECRNTAKG